MEVSNETSDNHFINMAVEKAFKEHGCVPDVVDTAPAELAEVQRCEDN